MAAFRDEATPIFDRVVALDLASGRYRDVFRFAGPDDTLPNNAQNLAIAVSPDGRTLVLNWRDRAAAARGIEAVHLATVGVDGQGLQELVAPYRAVNLRNKLAWSRDGWIYFPTAVDPADDEIVRVMRVRSTGGSPMPVGVEAAGLDSVALSPDGDRIAFYTLRPEGAGNLHWTLDAQAALRASR
jgi:hypothetical protein